MVAAECAMLEAHGHEVVLFQRNNEEINGWSPLQKIFRVIWNRQACADMEALIASFKPDVIHVHNVFHAMSLSVYQAARRKKVPIIQTLHNYRLFCLNGLFFRKRNRELKVEPACGLVKNVQVGKKDSSILPASTSNGLNASCGAICELCLKYKRFPVPGVQYRCYRGSLAGSFVVALMLFMHRIFRTWINPVSRFIVLTSFCRDKFIECGIPPERIAVKSHFLPQDPGEGLPKRDPHFLFLGRLSEEKGIRTLVEGWKIFEMRSTVSDKTCVESQEVGSQLSDSGCQRSDPKLSDPDLKNTTSTFSDSTSNKISANDFYADSPQLFVAGTGSLADEVKQAKVHGLKLCGHLSRTKSVELLQKVSCLIFSSVCYETFGLSVIEAMACGTPVLVSTDCAASSLVRDGETGILFRMGDPNDLADKIKWVIGHPVEMRRMGEAARQEYEQRYTAEVNYTLLMDVYKQAALIQPCVRQKDSFAQNGAK